MMMKLVVTFALIWLSGCQAFSFSDSREEENAIKIATSEIDFIFDNYDKIMDKFLKGQHESVSGPVREFANCICSNYSETLRTAMVNLATSTIKNESLEERRKLCQPPNTKIIFDLNSCADNIKPSTELTEIFHAMIYLPFRMICTYDFTNYSPKTYVALKNCTECPEMIAKLSQIITGDRKATKEDECLPIKFAKAFRTSLAAETPELESIDFDMIQELVRFYITTQAKLPFVSYFDCYNLED